MKAFPRNWFHQTVYTKQCNHNNRTSTICTFLTTSPTSLWRATRGDQHPSMIPCQERFDLNKNWASQLTKMFPNVENLNHPPFQLIIAAITITSNYNKGSKPIRIVSKICLTFTVKCLYLTILHKDHKSNNVSLSTTGIWQPVDHRPALVKREHDVTVHMWRFMWRDRWSLREKARSQRWHWNGRSPVCFL